jgi:hypothetical protein
MANLVFRGGVVSAACSLLLASCCNVALAGNPCSSEVGEARSVQKRRISPNDYPMIFPLASQLVPLYVWITSPGNWSRPSKVVAVGTSFNPFCNKPARLDSKCMCWSSKTAARVLTVGLPVILANSANAWNDSIKNY